MDVVGHALTHRHLPSLAALAGIEAQYDRIQEELRAVLDALPRQPSGAMPRSSLTSSGYPVELGLTIDRGRPTGLKYTVDLLVSGSASAILDSVWRETAPVVHRFADAAGRAELERYVSLLVFQSSGAIDGVYWSVAYARDGPPRMKIHVVGRGDALNRSVLQNLVPRVVAPVALDAALAGAELSGAVSAHFVGLSVDPNGAVRCKLYLLTNPFLDLRTVTRLAAALGLSTGRALSLLRWYRRFIGHHVGQLGSFGVGVELDNRSRNAGVEAYAYPSHANRARLQRRIDAHASAGRCLAELWTSLQPSEPSGADAPLYLAGCGTETASFARLGRMTVYLGVATEHLQASAAVGVREGLRTK